MTIFTPQQRRRIRELRASMNALAQLERDHHDLRHWQAAAAAAREGLTIIQQATGIDSTVDEPAALAAAAIAEGVQVEIEVHQTEVEVDLTPAQQAIEEIFDELYGQLVAHVQSLEAIAANIEHYNEVKTDLTLVETQMRQPRPTDDGWDNLRLCEVCGDRYCVGPSTKCDICLQQEMIDKYG